MSKKSNKLQWKFAKINGQIDRRYKVSAEGDVFNVKKGKLVTTHNMQKKSPFNGTDYQGICIAGQKLRLHRLVCETFHGKAPAGKDVVLHLDERKNNNNAKNLRWGDLSENTQGYLESRNYKRPSHSEAKIRRVKTLINKGYTNDRVAQMTKVGDSSVSLIKMGRSRRTVLPFTEQQIALGNI